MTALIPCGFFLGFQSVPFLNQMVFFYFCCSVFLGPAHFPCLAFHQGGTGDVEIIVLHHPLSIYFKYKSPFITPGKVGRSFYNVRKAISWEILLWKCSPEPAADQIASTKIACLNVGPSSLIYCECGRGEPNPLSGGVAPHLFIGPIYYS